MTMKHNLDNYCGTIHNDFDEIIHKKCFYDFDVRFDELCDQCFINYINNNFDKINNAIIELNCHAMACLGKYYCVINDYNKMKYYYLMAIYNVNQSSNAMAYLGTFYMDDDVLKRYDLAKKYLSMGVEKNNLLALNNLGYYYTVIEKDINLSKKYYSISLEIKQQSDVYFNLGYIYGRYDDNNEMAKEYLLKSIEMSYIQPITKYTAIDILKYIMPILHIYLTVQNKQFVIDHLNDEERANLNIFIDNTSIQICEICFATTQCVEMYSKDDTNTTYVCGFCF